jgi:hypothetical protein
VDDDGESCDPAVVALDIAMNASVFKSGPKALEPKAKLTLHYLVI